MDEDRATQLETLHRLTGRLYSATGMEAMLDAALDAISEGLGCATCAILLLDGEGIMRFVAWRGLTEHCRRRLEGHAPWTPGTLDSQPIFVPDIGELAESDLLRQTRLDEDVRGLAFIPITSQGKAIGTLMACHREANACGEGGRALAVTIARQLSFSLERAAAERARLAGPEGPQLRELMLAELNHRVKNTLAVVQGLAYQTFRNTDATARRAFEGRLQALAAAHDLLSRSHWESPSLDQLVNEALTSAGANRARVSASGPAIRLSPQAALHIALALHELFINTLRHGALSNPEGRVLLAWRHLDSAGKLRIEWREEDGPPVAPPQHRGLGSLLLERMLATDLEGRVALAFEPSGVVCVIELPIAEPGGRPCLG